MKNRRIVLFVLLAGCLMIGCQKKVNQDNSTKTEMKANAIENTKDNKDSKTKSEAKNVTNESLKEATSDSQADVEQNLTGVSVMIYSENENADGFDTEEVKVEKVSAENLIEQLKKRGMLTEDVQVNSFEETEDEGEKALKLDLNEAYLQKLQSMGSCGEYMLMGSVCNTFLDAYECNKIQITVDGQEIVTGHTDYPGYMGKFE